MKTISAIVLFLLSLSTSGYSQSASSGNSKFTPESNSEGLKLHTFEAISTEIGVTIRWITDVENNCSHYTVERSSNGTDFIEIARIDAAGESNMLIEYLLIDNDPLIGTSFYRIRQTDKEGNYRRSHLFTVVRDEKEETLAAEKILRDSLDGFISHDVILVRDNDGNEFFSKVILVKRGDEIIAIDPEKNIPPGNYMVLASSHNLIRSARILVE